MAGSFWSMRVGSLPRLGQLGTAAEKGAWPAGCYGRGPISTVWRFSSITAPDCGWRAGAHSRMASNLSHSAKLLARSLAGELRRSSGMRTRVPDDVLYGRARMCASFRICRYASLPDASDGGNSPTSTSPAVRFNSPLMYCVAARFERGIPVSYAIWPAVCLLQGESLRPDRTGRAPALQ